MDHLSRQLLTNLGAAAYRLNAPLLPFWYNQYNIFFLDYNLPFC